jgi:hypothetical protein
VLVLLLVVKTLMPPSLLPLPLILLVLVLVLFLLLLPTILLQPRLAGGWCSTTCDTLAPAQRGGE